MFRMNNTAIELYLFFGVGINKLFKCWLHCTMVVQGIRRVNRYGVLLYVLGGPAF